jgi:alpha-tubulin suppressor-like RCC1 family protein
VVAPATATIEVFDTVRLTATPRDSSGNVITGRPITWSSSEPGNVPVLASGRVQGFQRDTATITATVDGVNGTATVIVRVSVVSVNVPALVTVLWGDSVRVLAQIQGTGGLTPDNPSVTWVTRDTMIAIVSATGLVLARGSGTTFVVAEAGGRRDSTLVQVPPRVATVELTPATDTLLADSTVQFIVSLRDSTGAPATVSSISWSSLDTLVAAVTGGGLATGRGHGVAGIVAAAQGRSDTATLVVYRPTVASVDVAPDTIALWTDERSQLTATLRDSAGNLLVRRATWSSAAPGTATVDTTGRLTGVAAGRTVIRATADGATDSVAVTVDTMAGRIIALSGGEYFTCALTDAQVVYCWGANGDGQVGVDRADRPCDTILACIGRPSRVVSPVLFAALASGQEHSCALGVDSVAYCWGSDRFGQLGGGPTVTCPSGYACSPAPQAVGGGIKFLAVAAGAYHTCAIAADSTAYCWGNNYDHQLGVDSLVTTPHPSPTPVYGGLRFRTLALGRSHSCALTGSGASYCWGDNTPFGGTFTTKAPTALGGGLTFILLTSGLYHACGLTPAGVAYCWGLNGSGMLGNGTTQPSANPTSVNGGTFSSLSAGGTTTCGVTSVSQTMCWGNNDNGQLGGGAGGYQVVPVLVPGVPTFGSVAVAGYHVCGVVPGNAHCWGNNGLGQAGIGPASPTIVGPTRVIGQH